MKIVVCLIAALLWGCPEQVEPGAADLSGPSPDRDGGGPAPDGPPLIDPPPKAERSYALRLDDSPTPPLILDMDREEVSQLLGAVADDIVLLELDSTPLLQNILDAVKSACGDDWRRDVQDPTFDCESTPLGQTFAADGRWQFSPEFSLVRVLTMTPANVIVDGTSIEFLQSVADFFDIGGGFGQILSDSLFIDRTEEVVTTREVVRSLRENLLETHPGTVAGGRIRLTLLDALEDLATLADKLGPTANHPGVLDPDFTPHGEVLGPDFRMRVEALSNIRVVQGIRAQAGIDDINVLVDRTGPAFDDPLEFDFTDPNRFTITGLVPEPRVDMRFAILEHDRFAPACIDSDDCQDNFPDNPVGARSVWSLPPWTLEYITAYAALLKYRDLRSDNCYIACAATRVSIGQDGNPPGWVHFGVPLDLGPKDQYVWEFISEVAQVALHGEDYAVFDEGDVDVKFTLSGVFAGITGAEAAEATRPYLQQQGPAIAEFLLGNFRERSGEVDFYFRRTADGAPALFFVAPEDLAAGRAYTWQRPGFFADAALQTKVSRTVLPGSEDTTHEKLLLEGGEQIVYLEDAAGRRFKLRIVAQTAGSADIEVHLAEL